MRKRLLIRISLIAAFFVLVVLLIVMRLYALQITHSEKYRLTAERQYVNTTSGIYNRGNVFTVGSNNEKLAAATIRTMHTLAIDPRHLKHPEEAHAELNAIIPIDKGDFIMRAGKRDDPYEEIAQELDEAVVTAIQALEIPGVLLVPERKRYYPGGNFAAHTLGFVAFDDTNAKVGRYGVERYYEDVLVRDASNLYVNFFAELFTDIQEGVVGDVHREGDVVLTLDPTLQVYVEEILAKTQQKWQSKMTAAIVMDPQTGAILAMAANPTFDLNSFGEHGKHGYANPLVSSVYEMGSIIKVLTMAAGLDISAVKPETTYDDKGALTLNGATIHNYDGRARGVVPMQEVLSQSLNTGVAFVADRVGHAGMRTYFLDRLRLGEETGIDLPAEALGIVKNLQSKREIEFATASFGQGIALTPVATIRALAAVTNGGYLVQPHIVKSIEYTNGMTKEFDYTDQKEKVFKESTSEKINTMLTTVVDDVLAGGTVKLENYSLGAKTGTAQLAEAGGYRDDAYLHTFFGYGPSYNPEFVVLLMNLEPQEARYASETLTDPFMDIAQFTINHLNIAPDR